MAISLILFFILGISLFTNSVLSIKNSAYLLSYIQKVNYPKWQLMTTCVVFGINIGPGMNSSIGILTYIFSREDDDDKTILDYKKRIRLHNYIIIFTFALLILYFTGTFVLTPYIKLGF